MKTATHALDIRSIIDPEPVSAFQGLVMLLCFLVLAVDGYDTAAMSFVAPVLAHAWQIDRSTLGPVMSAAFIGIGFGALVAGPLADRFGRKTVLVLALIFIGAWSLASATAHSTGELWAFRLLTGLGLGASLPNGITLASEFAPRRLRGMLVNSVLCGFSAGVIVGGVASSRLIPTMGWPSVLVAGGAVPILLALCLMMLMPESTQFLVTRPGTHDRIARILSRIAPHRSFEDCSFVSGESTAKSTFAARVVLSRQYAMQTIMLWVAYFMICVIYYLLLSWMPTLFNVAGFTVAFAALLTSMFPLGGVVGALVGGWLFDRIGAHRTIILSFLVSGALAIIIGQSVDLTTTLLGVLLFLCGLVMTCASTSMTTFAAVIYPTEGRSTGVSWMMSFGRIGAACGAFVGATLLGLGWQVSSVFGLLAFPSLVGALAIYVIAREHPDISRTSVKDIVVDHH